MPPSSPQVDVAAACRNNQPTVIFTKVVPGPYFVEVDDSWEWIGETTTQVLSWPTSSGFLVDQANWRVTDADTGVQLASGQFQLNEYCDPNSVFVPTLHCGYEHPPTFELRLNRPGDYWVRTSLRPDRTDTLDLLHLTTSSPDVVRDWPRDGVGHLVPALYWQGGPTGQPDTINGVLLTSLDQTCATFDASP